MIRPAMAFQVFRHSARRAWWSAAILGIALAAALPASAAAPANGVHPVTARLVPEAASMAPGTTLWVDLHLDIAPGWHTYWRNPGDAGLPTEIAWTLPAGFTAGDIVWPVPERFVVDGLGNYGYRNSVDLLVRITVSHNVESGGTATLAAAGCWRGRAPRRRPCRQSLTVVWSCTGRAASRRCRFMPRLQPRAQWARAPAISLGGKRCSLRWSAASC